MVMRTTGHKLSVRVVGGMCVASTATHTAHVFLTAFVRNVLTDVEGIEEAVVAKRLWGIDALGSVCNHDLVYLQDIDVDAEIDHDEVKMIPTQRTSVWDSSVAVLGPATAKLVPMGEEIIPTLIALGADEDVVDRARRALADEMAKSARWVELIALRQAVKVIKAAHVAGLINGDVDAVASALLKGVETDED